MTPRTTGSRFGSTVSNPTRWTTRARRRFKPSRSATLPYQGGWRNPCAPGPDALAMGFPISGQINGPEAPAGAGTFRLTCTSGAVGKCVRLGYKPRKPTPDGVTSLAPYHEACLRMVRADYCGDGTPHTRDGTLINIYDRLSIQRRESRPGMEFDAAWEPHGAVCVGRVRVPELTSLDALAHTCPGKFVGQTGATCTEETALRLGGALILNEAAR
ncbi:ADYC domain-containing protein [Roseomonas sp. GCM10028921]